MYKYNPKSESKVRTNLNSTLDFFKRKNNANEGYHKKILSHIKIDGSNNNNNLITVINYKVNNVNNISVKNTDVGQFHKRKSNSKPNKLINNLITIGKPNTINSTLSLLKTDLYQVDTYIQNNKGILRYFQDDYGSILPTKNLKNKIKGIKESLGFSMESIFERCNSSAIEQVRQITNSIGRSNEDFSQMLLPILNENYLMKELLAKLEDLFFLLNLRLFDNEKDFAETALENLSKITNIKYMCKKVGNEKFAKRGSSNNNNLLRSVDDIPKFKESLINLNFHETKKKTNNPLRKNSNKIDNNIDDSLSNLLDDDKGKANNKKAEERLSKQMKEEDILENVEADIKDDNEENNNKEEKKNNNVSSYKELKKISEDINEMKKLADFINYGESNIEEINSIFTKLKDLFFAYIKVIFKAPLDLILNQLKIKDDYTDRVQAVIKNDLNEVLENSVLMRKIFENYINNLIKEKDELTKKNAILESEKQKVDNELNKNKKRLDIIENRNYKTYYEQMKKDNEEFLTEYKKLRGDNYQRLIAEIENKATKNNELKMKIKSLESEIFTMKLDLNTYRKEFKNSGEYAEALKEQFDDAAKTFRDEIDDLTKKYYMKKEEQAKKMLKLETDNKDLKIVQELLNKRLDINDKLF